MSSPYREEGEGEASPDYSAVARRFLELEEGKDRAYWSRVAKLAKGCADALAANIEESSTTTTCSPSGMALWVAKYLNEHQNEFFGPQVRVEYNTYGEISLKVRKPPVPSERTCTADSVELVTCTQASPVQGRRW